MKKTIILQDLDCANCAAKIEHAVGRVDGVIGVTVNFLSQKMTLETSDNYNEVLKQVIQVIKKVEPDVTVKI